MDDDAYLWDGRGVDPELQALEALIGAFAHDGRPLAFVPRRRPVVAPWYAAAAAAVLVMQLGFALRAVPGAAHLADRGPVTLRTARDREALGAGLWFTATGDRRELMIGDLGHIILDEGSRLRVHRVDTGKARLYLERGGLFAQVSGNARPRFFQVETPSTTCVDLGCKYTLKVDERGDTVVAVLTGRVAFEDHGREVYVPAHATCRASRRYGTGTPRFEDAPASLVAALAAFDAANHAAPAVRLERARALLAQVRAPHDFLPAWHLLQDDEPAIVTAAVAHLEQVAGRPADAASAGAPGPVERQVWKRYLAAQWRPKPPTIH